ncbi:TPA: hypothetical protein ON523_003031 [Morganella morganii]|nr:hypothetical protein [Morganella morganii]
MKKNIIFFIFLFGFCFSSLAVTNGKEITAPLGLKWGMTKNELIEKSGNIKEKGFEGGIEQLLIINESNNIDGLNMYVAGVDKEYGLVSVEMVFFINEDMNGNKAIEKYNILKKVLVSKYGEQYVDEYAWRNYSKGDVSFSDCIRNKGCGNYFSSFEDDKGGLAWLMISPSASEEGTNIYLLYKSPAIKKIQEEAKASSESEVQKKAQALSDSL